MFESSSGHHVGTLSKFLAYNALQYNCICAASELGVYGKKAISKISCIVLYCIVLYCIVLYCIVLYCIVLYCIVLNVSLVLSVLSNRHRNLRTSKATLAS